ncbi:hypothetical protein ACQPW1_19690 [Nocardia sp. CA-128927]|uniref:hypothetical protein n=1 Tax=Nocardia sp. CA-128927 TaxID=3239975 RepID=UPI003D994E42
MVAQEQDLADALRSTVRPSDEFTAHLVAAQVFSAQRILTYHNAQAIRSGQSADEIYQTAVAHAETAFGLLESGLPRRS